MGNISLLWDTVVSCGTEHFLLGKKSHVEESVLVWNKGVLFGIADLHRREKSQKFQYNFPDN